MNRDPLSIEHHEMDGDVWYALSFRPEELPTLRRAVLAAGGAPTGHAIDAVMVWIAERGSPAWAQVLQFDSENDLFCVRSPRQAPLRFLARRLQKRLDDPVALRRAVAAVVTA